MIAAVFTAVGFAQETEPEPASLSIKSFSLSLENAVYINFKVASTSVTNPSAIKILAWENAPESYVKGTEDHCLSTKGKENGTGHEIFQYDNLAAKDMTKMVYVCAYVNENGVETYSSPAKFSVAMYAYLKKNAANPDTDLVALMDSMLAYGAQAQTYFKHNTEFLANAPMGQVTVKNGTLSDGFSLGWYKAGTTVTLTANDPEEGYEFSHWENTAGESVSTNEVFEAPVAEGNQTYTAVYEKSAMASQGLAFTANADGTYSVSGFGSCADTDIIIPSTYEGKPVTAIATDAFYDNTGRRLTSVTIPSSVTEIKPRAFVSCYGLKEVILSEGLETIGTQAFWESPITTINLPTTLTYVGSNAFMECTRIEEVHITDIGSYCSIDFGNEAANPLWDGGVLYLNGTPVTSVTVPTGVTRIGANVFVGYSGITEVTLPHSVTSIGAYAFFGARNLTRINIPSSVATISNYAFANNSKLTIYCEAASQPDGWSSDWNYGYASGPNAPVVWGFDAVIRTYTFATNGGNTISPIQSMYSITLPIPIKTDYYFVGWYDSASFIGDPIIGEYYGDSDTMLYARWMTESEYKLYCNATSLPRAKRITSGTEILFDGTEMLYFRFQVEETGYYDVESSGDADTYGTLYNSNYAILDSNDDSGAGDNFSIYKYLTAGETYYLAVKKYDSGSAFVTLTFS